MTGDGRALIDSQTLVAGTSEGPFQPPADNYRLDLESGGPVTVTLDGTPHRLDSANAATFHIDSSGIQKAPDYRGPDCP